MNKKIILTLVLLIFARQEYFAMENQNPNGPQSLVNSQSKLITKNKNSFIKWKTINNWVNGTDNDYPKLWLLWTILDNIHIQYGNSKVWKHAEAYCGLSNGIGFFHSLLNFGWIKIGLGDVHFNIINVIIHGAKEFVRKKKMQKNKKFEWGDFLFNSIVYDFLIFNILWAGIHLFSFKIFNGIKIKLISIGGIIGKICFEEPYNKNESIHSWYHHICDNMNRISPIYMIISPRIEINIAELINYFKKS